MIKRIIIIALVAFSLLVSISLYPLFEWAKNLYVITESTVQSSTWFFLEKAPIFREMSRFATNDYMRHMFLYNAGVSALRGDDFSGAIQDFRKSSLEGTDITIAFRSFANIGNAYVRWSSIIPGKQGRLLFLDAMDSYIRALSTQYDGAVQINYFLVLKTTIAFLDKVIFADTPQQSLHGLILACGSGITLQSLSLPTLGGYPQHNEAFIQEWPCIHAHLKELFSYIQETRDTEKDPSDKSWSWSSRSSVSGEASSQSSSLDPGNRSWTNAGETKFQYKNEFFDQASWSWSRDAFFEKTIREIRDFQERSGRYFLNLPLPHDPFEMTNPRKSW